MTVFADLPNEMIDIILSFVEPEDLENFAQVQRRVQELARSLLQTHREMIRKYRTLNDESVSPLLKLVLVKPLVGRYVEMMDLRNMEGRYEYQDEHVDDDFDSIRLAATEAKEHLFPRVDIEDLLDPTSDAYDRRGLGLALLLPFLPNLNVIRFRDAEFSQSWVDSFIANAPRAANPVLPKLQKIQIHSQLGFTLARLLPLAALPSLKELSASRLAKWFDSNRLETLPTASEITKLELYDSSVSFETLHTFLQIFYKLETFTISIDHGQNQLNFDARLLRNALLPQAKMTLRTLTVLGLPEQLSFIGSLREFEVLTKIHTVWVVLLPSIQAQLSAVLPGSLCHLRLHDPEIHNATIYKALLHDTLCGKVSRILHLEHLTFVIPKAYEHYENRLDLRQDCRESGLDVTIVHGDLIPERESLDLL